MAMAHRVSSLRGDSGINSPPKPFDLPPANITLAQAQRVKGGAAQGKLW